MASSYLPQVASVTNVANAQNATEASNFATDTVDEIKSTMSDGNVSLRLISRLVAFAMLVSSIAGFVGNFLTLHWIAAIFKIFPFLVGVLVMLLESGQRLSMLSGIRESLLAAAPFLQSVWGRGATYIAAGLILIYMRNLVDIVLGILICVVGIMYILVSRRASTKLRGLDREGVICTDEELQEKFALADIDGRGALSLKQFQQLVNALGLQLDKQETEIVFLQIDSSPNERITYEAIRTWWSSVNTSTTNP